MPINVRCSCGKGYKVAEKLAGKKIRCQVCENVLTIRRPAAVATKQPAGSNGSDSGFLDMDLDSEFSQMRTVEHRREEESQESRFMDPRERTGLKEAGLDKPAPKQAEIYIPSVPLLEKGIEKMIPALGLGLGLAILGAFFLLVMNYGIFWPWWGSSSRFTV